MKDSFRRIEEFIGHPEQVEFIRKAFTEAQEAARPKAVAVEADAGLGKSHLLNGLHLILDPKHSSTTLCIAQIIDLSDTNTRSPNAIQGKIIDGLAQTEAREPYRFSQNRVSRAFLEYTEKYKELQARRSGLSAAEIRQYQQDLSALFVKAYRTLAAERTIVLSFDTTEALVSLQPEHDLGEVRQNSAELFFSWIETVLPQLPRTLAVFCGRPVRLDQELAETGFKLRPAGRSIATVLRQTRLLFGEVQVLKPLDREGIAAYLRAYGEPPADERQVEQIRKQTDGMPLLITCLIEDRHFPRQFQPAPESRADFERQILEYLLNPLRSLADPQRQLFNYGLYVLSYARRGLQRSQLKRFLVEYGYTEDPVGQRPPLGDEQIEAVLQQMERMALIKRRPDTDLLYLHDHFYSLIDASGRPGALEMRDEVLSFLIEDAEERLVAATDRGSKFIALSDLVYYLLVTDPMRGYRAYLTATYQLFEETEINSALVLRDELWQWLSVERNRERIRTSQLELVEVVRDDAVWLVRYHLRTGDHTQAVEIGKQVRQRYEAAATDESADAYFIASLYTALGAALTLEKDANPEDAEALFQRAIEILKGPDWRDIYLQHHHDFLLAEAYTAAGYLEATLNRYEHASTLNREAFEAYSRYLPPSDEPLPRFELDEPLSQLVLNMAYSEVQLGNYARAQKLLDDYLLRARDDQPPRVERLSIDRQALAYNVLSILQLEMGNLEAAERATAKALERARVAARRRTFGLVLMHQGAVLHERMKRDGEYSDEPIASFRDAATIFANEASSLRELHIHWGKYERGYGESLLERKQIAEAQVHFNRALQNFDEALLASGTTASLAEDPEPTIQAAELLHGKAVVYRLLGEKAEALRLLDKAAAMLATAVMPYYAQIVAGSIAYERAAHALEDGNIAGLVEHALIALARAFAFSPENRTVSAFKRRFNRIFRNLDSAQLERAAAVLAADGAMFLDYDRLPYQRPEMKKWVAAAMRSDEFFQDLLAQLNM